MGFFKSKTASKDSQPQGSELVRTDKGMSRARDSTYSGTTTNSDASSAEARTSEPIVPPPGTTVTTTYTVSKDGLTSQSSHPYQAAIDPPPATMTVQKPNEAPTQAPVKAGQLPASGGIIPLSLIEGAESKGSVVEAPTLSCSEERDNGSSSPLQNLAAKIPHENQSFASSTKNHTQIQNGHDSQKQDKTPTGSRNNNISEHDADGSRSATQKSNGGKISPSHQSKGQMSSPATLKPQGSSHANSASSEKNGTSNGMSSPYSNKNNNPLSTVTENPDSPRSLSFDKKSQNKSSTSSSKPQGTDYSRSNQHSSSTTNSLSKPSERNPLNSHPVDVVKPKSARGVTPLSPRPSNNNLTHTLTPLTPEYLGAVDQALQQSESFEQAQRSRPSTADRNNQTPGFGQGLKQADTARVSPPGSVKLVHNSRGSHGDGSPNSRQDRSTYWEESEAATTDYHSDIDASESSMGSTEDDLEAFGNKGTNKYSSSGVARQNTPRDARTSPASQSIAHHTTARGAGLNDGQTVAPYASGKQNTYSRHGDAEQSSYITREHESSPERERFSNPPGVQLNSRSAGRNASPQEERSSTHGPQGASSTTKHVSHHEPPKPSSNYASREVQTSPPPAPSVHFESSHNSQSSDRSPTKTTSSYSNRDQQTSTSTNQHDKPCRDSTNVSSPPFVNQSSSKPTASRTTHGVSDRSANEDKHMPSRPNKSSRDVELPPKPNTSTKPILSRSSSRNASSHNPHNSSGDRDPESPGLWRDTCKRNTSYTSAREEWSQDEHEHESGNNQGFGARNHPGKVRFEGTFSLGAH